MAAVNRTPARDYGGATAAEREERRRELLLDAGLTLLAQAGRHELTIGALCAEAGLNKRYFYEAFADVEALVVALVRRIAEDATANGLGALGPEPHTVEDARRATAAFIAHLTEDPRRARVLFGALPAGDAAAVHRASAVREAVALVAAHGRDLYGLGADPRADIAAAVMVGGTGQAVLDWLDGRIACSREALVDELVAGWLALADATTARVRGDAGE